MNANILTTAQAAKILGVSTRTAQLWMENGSLASWKTPGGHRRAHSADVYALVNANNGGTAGAAPVRSSFLELDGSQGLSYPVGQNEHLRLAAVERAGIVDSRPEQDFDDLAKVAADILQVPVALITLLTPTKQWFKSHVGLDLKETPRSWAFCNYTVLQNEIFQVEDLSKDSRFATNPAVIGEPHFRFYAGSPILDSDGLALGSLCVIDMKPRALDAKQRKVLSVLAAQVAAQIKLRTSNRALLRASTELSRRGLA